MTPNDLYNLVTTVAFPIVMCGAMGWYVKYTHDHHRADIKELNAQHAEETELLSQAVNNNTLVMQRLVDKLGEEHEN